MPIEFADHVAAPETAPADGVKAFRESERDMSDRSGFTLIELLIVLVIIGILAAIAVPRFSATREMAYYAAMKADVRNVAALQELHHAGNYTYSASAATLGFVASDGVNVTLDASSTGWSATATHDALDAAEGCVVFYGDATAPTLGSTTPTAEGQVECTD